MAKLETVEIQALEGVFDRLDREGLRRIVEAGGEAVAERMRAVIVARHHVVSGHMRDATKRGHVRERLGGATVEIYPGAQGDSEGPTGIRPSRKAFLIEKGIGQRPNTKRSRGRIRNKTPDHFITGDDLGYADAANAAMQAENDRILDELQ